MKPTVPDRRLRVCLATMPWQSLESPSLPIGLLRAVAAAAGREPPTAYHGNLRWAEFLLERSAGEITPEEYTYIAELGIFEGFGDWVFTGVLHGDDAFARDAFSEYLARTGADPGEASRMREYADEFVDLVAREILARSPELVGLTTTFMQNVSSLAVAARIKRYDPSVRIVLGGGNCDGPMGAALHRNHPYLDYVVRGEGEEVFPALLDAIERGRPPVDLPGVCYWQDGASVANPESRRPLAPGRIPTPDFDDWFATFEASPVERYVEPKLILEMARGCWWGAAHQCTFCGLNGSFIEFRSKPPQRAIEEIKELVTRHKVLDIIMVDNIIDQHYYADVLPALAAVDWDLRLHYEIKSNIKPAHVSALRAARVVHVQPGIESLSTPVLRLMDKGVDAIQNVRALRDCESARLTVSWNWLFGFPGELPEHYRSVLPQLPALVHLQPPNGADRILLERFSPYFDRPELGFRARRPAHIYRHVYALQDAELADLVYLFDCDPAGIDGETVQTLQQLVADWKKAYVDSALVRIDDGERLLIQDRRGGWPERDHVIDEPVLVAAYRELETGRSIPALCRALAASGTELDPTRAADWLAELRSAGLVFEADDRFLALATTCIPVRIER
jgi:ribosomal peptide maturation radical SAM protein 1